MNVRWGLAAVAIAALVVTAVVVGADLPRNAHWVEPRQGVLVYVRSNGVHVDLVLPSNAPYDWLHFLSLPYCEQQRLHHVDDCFSPGWLAFGWGQREFYTETPTWADIKLRNLIRVVVGGAAVVRVEPLNQPPFPPSVHTLALDPASYHLLAQFLRDSFALGADALPIPLEQTGHGTDGVFFEATGRYHLIRTSNQWAADALGAAGVRVGLWTPFAQTLMWSLR